MGTARAIGGVGSCGRAGAAAVRMVAKRAHAEEQEQKHMLAGAGGRARGKVGERAGAMQELRCGQASARAERAGERTGVAAGERVPAERAGAL
uniref:Uncharacterized protein n=1 Tax=Arundo donax TaxID=35708 RepID=A0A0A9G5F8_ARUDO